MKAIILAAGRGSRMGEKTAELPKCMMTLFGKTLIERCIENLEKAGFEREDISIVTGYKKEKITIHGTKYFHNENWENTNMFMSLMEAEEWLERDTCIVCYSDIVFHPNAVKTLMESTCKFAVTYYTGFWELWEKRFENPLEDLETFKLEGDKLTEIGKKPQKKEEIMGQYMGLIRIMPQGWKDIQEAIKLPMPKTVQKVDMTTLLQHLLSLGHEIDAIETNELWLECDNQNDVAVYEQMQCEL
jgi:choline kinase